MTQAAAARDYRVGQVWEYKTRSGEENSHVTIARIDTEKGYGNIYHIYVDHLRIKNPRTKTGFQAELPHSPVDQETLDKSVTKLVRTDAAIPDISQGYEAWREPFEQGHAGVFNISVAEIISLIEQTVERSQ